MSECLPFKSFPWIFKTINKTKIKHITKWSRKVEPSIGGRYSDSGDFINSKVKQIKTWSQNVVSSINENEKVLWAIILASTTLDWVVRRDALKNCV